MTATADTAFAELVVAACAVATPAGAELAHQRVTADAFTRPALAAVFTAAGNAPRFPLPTEAEATAWAHARITGQPEPDIWPTERRIAHIALEAGVTINALNHLIAQRPVAQDTTGHYARELNAAHQRRQLLLRAVELQDLLASGDTTRAATTATTIATLLEEATT